jgi:hypothetical protein
MKNDLITIDEQTHGLDLATAVQVANQLAGTQVFDDYRGRLAENTKGRQMI